MDDTYVFISEVGTQRIPWKIHSFSMTSTIVHDRKNIFLCHFSNCVESPLKPGIVLFCIHLCVTLVTIERLQSSKHYVSKTSWVGCMSNVPHWQDVRTIGINRHDNCYPIFFPLKVSSSNMSSVVRGRQIGYSRAQPVEQTRLVHIVDISERVHIS